MKTLLAIILSCTALVGYAPTPLANATANDSMVVLINAERTKANLPALIENPKLAASATAKACDMRDKNYFAHNPEGGTPWPKFILAANYSYRYAGENLAKDFNDDITAMARLIASPTHAANILSKHFTEVGIGRCGVYTVQHFGRRQKLW